MLISIGFASGVISLSKKQVLVRELHSLENLAHCDVVCLNKTGTLTEGKRVIYAGICNGEVVPENVDIVGMIVISDTVRKNAQDTIRYLYSQWIDVKVISGDNAYSVSAISKKAGYSCV